jgi:hypothetical protein
MAGTLVVRDADNAIDGVFLINGGSTVAVPRRPGGIYATTAQIEGSALVKCRNGRRIQFGYITSGLHEWRTIRARDCAVGRVPD